MVGKARHFGTQAANAPHHEIDFHAGHAGPVERVDNFWINQRVQLAPDLGWPAGGGMGDLFVNVLQDPLLQVHGSVLQMHPLLDGSHSIFRQQLLLRFLPAVVVLTWLPLHG